MSKYMLLKDHVYNYIVEQINAGEMVAGKKLNESAISKNLQVSRTPVREALIQLASDGLLENVPRKGFIIKELTKQDAVETYFIIGTLDGVAAALAVPFLQEKHFKEMEFYVESIELAINSENFAMYHKMQESFHEVYLNLCPNESLVNLLNQLKKKFLLRFDHLESIEFAQQKLRETNKEHREIITLFKRQDCKGLEKYLKEVHWDVKKAELVPL
ncbi:MAG TPA: GntR family transcriptional regulator [Globicatella sulfidifaciens]|nr:GntR family transcriptional regulator [Virgibacillus sp.]HIS28681.1 GntR family transcriptional regulator [Candidatus Avamphibacillus intestinigallinarum]HJF16616.1 GntR family transcriptional regulator [Globicatella sulfidifaciens]HLR69000.1 GntR family transcriptional regulator [Virgibacillus sp.]